MRRRRAKFAKVIETANDAAAKVMFPNAVHPHTRGERMFRTRNPTGQSQSIAGFVGSDGLGWLEWFFGKHHRQGRPDQRPRAAGSAAQVHIGGRGFPAIPQRADQRHRLLLDLQLVDFLFQLPALLAFHGLELFLHRLQLFVDLRIVCLHRLAFSRQSHGEVPATAAFPLITKSLRCQPIVLIVSRLEDGGEGIVIALADGIVFVIVALGALERKAEHAAGENLQLIINHLQAIFHAINRIGACAIGRHTQETGGDKLLNHIGVHRLGIGVIDQLIAGDLLEQKLVVRLVGIEGVDDVVAIFPGVLADHVRIAFALGIGIARHVQPMPAPTHAVSRRGEQTIHHLFQRRGTVILKKRRHLTSGRRQACQVKRDATQ